MRWYLRPRTASSKRAKKFEISCESVDPVAWIVFREKSMDHPIAVDVLYFV